MIADTMVDLLSFRVWLQVVVHEEFEMYISGVIGVVIPFYSSMLVTFSSSQCRYEGLTKK